MAPTSDRGYQGFSVQCGRQDFNLHAREGASPSNKRAVAASHSDDLYLQHIVDVVRRDMDLFEIVERWSNLPEHVKRTIVAIVAGMAPASANPRRPTKTKALRGSVYIKAS